MEQTSQRNLLDLAHRLKTLRDTKADAEAEVKRLNGEIDQATLELTDLMTENEMPSFTTADSPIRSPRASSRRRSPVTRMPCMPHSVKTAMVG